MQRAFASFPERAIALLSKECKALLGIPVGFITLEGSEGELRLAHRGAGIDHTQSPGGAAVRPAMQVSNRPGAEERIRWFKSSQQTSVECHQAIQVCP